MCTVWECGHWGCYTEATIQLYKTALQYMLSIVCEVCGMVLRDLCLCIIVPCMSLCAPFVCHSQLAIL